MFAFNRPELTKKVLHQISQAWDGNVIVMCDGPRLGNELDEENCQLVRDVCLEFQNRITLECVFQEENQGLKRSVVGGLAFGFSKFTQLIILEDDCLPDASFFPFCEQLLERHSNDFDIGMIQAGNHLGGYELDSDYYVSDRPKIWGWATWKSRWEGFDPDMASWFERPDKVEFLMGHGFSGRNLQRQIRTMSKANDIDTWDYQWVYHLWNQNMFSIAPRVNLVRNLGFGEHATHTVFVSHLAELGSQSLSFPLRPPANLNVRSDLDSLERRVERRSWFLDLARSPVSFAWRILDYLRSKLSNRAKTQIRPE